LQIIVFFERFTWSAGWKPAVPESLPILLIRELLIEKAHAYHGSRQGFTGTAGILPAHRF